MTDQYDEMADTLFPRIVSPITGDFVYRHPSRNDVADLLRKSAAVERAKFTNLLSAAKKTAEIMRRVVHKDAVPKFLIEAIAEAETILANSS